MEERLTELLKDGHEKYLYYDQIANYLIKNDVLEVVRCGKCRYCAKTKEYDFCTNKHNFIDRRALLVHPNHFCSYGKRK